MVVLDCGENKKGFLEQTLPCSNLNLNLKIQCDCIQNESLIILLAYCMKRLECILVKTMLFCSCM